MSLLERNRKKFVRDIEDWWLRSVTLESGALAKTKDNINKWLRDFERLYRKGMTDTNFIASFNQTIEMLGKEAGEEAIEEFIATQAEAFTQTDYNLARRQRNIIATNFKGNIEPFFDNWDTFQEREDMQGLTLREMKKRYLRQDLLAKRITSLRDSIGRQWTPDRYTEMYARTRNSEVADDTHSSVAIDLGEDVIQISNHGTTTPICKRYEGKIFSLTGSTPGLPVLRIVPPFHPNCKHFKRSIPARNISSYQDVNRQKNAEIRQFNTGLTDAQNKAIGRQTKWNRENRRIPSQQQAAA